MRVELGKTAAASMVDFDRPKNGGWSRPDCRNLASTVARGPLICRSRSRHTPNGSQQLVMAPAGGPAYAPGYAGPYAYSYEQPGPFGWAPYGYGGGWPPGRAASILYNIHTPPNH